MRKVIGIGETVLDIIFKGGKVVEQAVGARGKADVAAMLNRHL